ncbi:MAG: THUMP domain-containing protein [Bacteroidales bacterium]|nr:THUMP domain-containing protein [Bacteroidales bacterium]
MDSSSSKFKMVAKTFRGLENVLYKELKQLGATDLELGNRMVEFTGDKEFMYRANFHLRTALRILKPIAEFKVKDDTQLYNKIQSIDWSTYFDLENTFSIDSVIFSDHFSHSNFVTQRVKDAIADQFREKFQKRPYVDIEDPDIKIGIHISHDLCTVSLDSSGDSLHKRGYRQITNKAPLNEVLAAGMILLSGWDKKSTFIDPMCGSGTLIIEAALMANNIPPGIYRKKFGFETWKDFDNELLENIYEEDNVEPNPEVKVIGSDISEIAIRIAQENISNAGLKRKIEIKVDPIENFTPPNTENGIVVTNPPYGERIKINEINAFYKSLGDNFKTKYKGFEIWLLSNNNDAIKRVGLHPSSRVTLFNGALECKFLNYSIYEGSKKTKNKNTE